MPRSPSFTTAPLPFDEPAVAALVTAAGAHGVYVGNALAAGEGDGVLLLQRERPVGLCWFGPRGNLVVIAPPELEPGAVADTIGATRLPWRIAMGPGAVIDALRQRVAAPPLLHRDQLYFRAEPAGAAASLCRPDVRPAQRADRDRLTQATLFLNQSDLNIDPARVDRRWLRDSIDERIANATTWVIGPPGGPECKLDFGSTGPAGLVLEGVFTFASARGQGLARSLVASCLAAARWSPVVLHVGAYNAPAQAAYAAAGMVAVDRCRLLLLG